MQGVSLHEALLSSPVAALRMGGQVHRSPQAPGGVGAGARVAKADWNFHCVFALLLPLDAPQLVVRSWILRPKRQTFCPAHVGTRVAK